MLLYSIRFHVHYFGVPAPGRPLYWGSCKSVRYLWYTTVCTILDCSSYTALRTDEDEQMAASCQKDALAESVH
jgi:hypothetical protein